MKAVSGSDMRELDRRTICGSVCSGEELMERASAACASEILCFIRDAGFYPVPPIRILTGKGNNGGDGFGIARILSERLPGTEIRIYSACDTADLKGDAQTMFKRLPADLAATVSFSLTDQNLKHGMIVVDAMLGTGISGKLREPFRSWIKTVNASGAAVVSIDLPSGLNADSGKIEDDAVEADLTITIAQPKTGLLSPDAEAVCGRIRVVDIGIPKAFLTDVSHTEETMDESDFRVLIGREKANTYKNRRGHVLVIGGSALYPSAPFLTAEAALRAGAGLVTMAIPESAEIFCRVPRAVIVRRVPGDKKGCFNESSLTALVDLTESKSAVALGPGIGMDPETAGMVSGLLLSLKESPLILDADALNLIAQANLFRDLKGCHAVLTPHAGEMARMLLALGAYDDDLSNREKAMTLARLTSTVCLLKAPRTVVAAPDGRTSFNLSGCAALATAGSGDVLTGIIAALAATPDLDLFDAVRCGVYLHGRCGEVLAPCGSRGVIADDLSSAIRTAWERIAPVL